LFATQLNWHFSSDHFRRFLGALSPIYSDATQLNWTSSWVELCRYKWGFNGQRLQPIVCRRRAMCWTVSRRVFAQSLHVTDRCQAPTSEPPRSPADLHIHTYHHHHHHHHHTVSGSARIWCDGGGARKWEITF